MVEIRQAEDDLPGNRFLDLCGHTSGLLCRRHDQHSMRPSQRQRKCAQRVHWRFITRRENKHQACAKLF